MLAKNWPENLKKKKFVKLNQFFQKEKKIREIESIFQKEILHFKIKTF